MTWVEGSAPAALFVARFSALRRGPVEFAASWCSVFQRTPDAQPSGAGDPKIYARMRLTPPAWPVRFYLEGAVRVPTADPELFPYADGGQDFEVMGSVESHGELRAAGGVGRIFARPPSGSTLGDADVPEATHAWALLGRALGPVVLAARADGLLYDIEGEGRGILAASLAHREPSGFTITFEWAVEVGSAANRVFDYAPSLRFAIPLH